MSKNPALNIYSRILPAFDIVGKVVLKVDGTICQPLPWARCHNILVIKTMMIGDVLMVTPALASLRVGFPNARITMMVGRWSSEAVANNPNVDEVFTYEDRILLKQNLVSVLKLVSQLRMRQFDMIVSFHRSRLMNLLCYLIHARTRVGFDFRGSGYALTFPVHSDPADRRYPVEMNLDIPRAMGLPVTVRKPQIFLTEVERQAGRKILQNAGWDGKTAPIVIVPGGASNPSESIPIRRWPPRSFAQVCDVLSAQTGAPVILVGGSSDKEAAENVVDLAQFKPVDLSGRTSLRETMSVIALSRLVLTNDTSLLHVAIALDKPTIGLFGPSAGAFRVPLGDDRFTALQSPVECSPCYANENAFPGCRLGRAICMDGIHPTSVVAEVLRKGIV